MADVLTLKAPFVGSDGRPTIEPGAFYLDGNYAIRVNSWNSLVGVVVTVRARIIRASDGEIVDSSWDHTPNSNRTKATNDFPLPEGFILNITAFASSGSPLVGQTFVQVQLARGFSGATLLLATMLQDYVTSVQALAYPGSPIRSSIEGGGVIRQITGTLPAAGAEIGETVPTGARWQMLSFFSTLQTSAAVANRTARLRVNSAGGDFGDFLVSATQAASLNGFYTWGTGLTPLVDATWPMFQAPMPTDLVALAAMAFQTVTGNLQAADQWGAPHYIVREFLEAAA